MSPAPSPKRSTPAGNLTDSGTIAFTDVNLTDVHSVGAVTPSAGALGSLDRRRDHGPTGSGLGGVVTWHYSVAAAAVEFLAAGQTRVQTFSFNVQDGQGGTCRAASASRSPAPTTRRTSGACRPTARQRR